MPLKKSTNTSKVVSLQINKPKLAYFVSMVSGLESFVKNEIDKLHSNGFEISLFVTKYRQSKGFEPNKGIALNKVNVIAIISSLLKSLVTKPVLTFRLFVEALNYKAIPEVILAISWSEILKRENFGLLHASFGDRKFFAAYFAHRLTGIPVTVAIHAHEIYAQPNDAMFRHALKYVKKIVTISEKNRSILIDKYSVDESKIDLIRLPINTEFWKKSPKIKVLTIARFTPRKGWLELIEAAKQVNDRFHFVAVGFGDLDIEDIVKNEGVSDKFTVFPKLNAPQIKILMETVDVFCLPSKPTEDEGSEGIPVALMEAMSMELPIITTSDGSITELVDKKVIEPGSVEALVSAFEELQQELEAPDADSKGNKENREKVLNMHNPKNIDRLAEFFIESAQ